MKDKGLFGGNYIEKYSIDLAIGDILAIDSDRGSTCIRGTNGEQYLGGITPDKLIRYYAAVKNLSLEKENTFQKVFFYELNPENTLRVDICIKGADFMLYIDIPPYFYKMEGVKYSLFPIGYLCKKIANEVKKCNKLNEEKLLLRSMVLLSGSVRVYLE